MITKKRILEIVAEINKDGKGATKQVVSEYFDTPEEAQRRLDTDYEPEMDVRDWAKAINFKNAAYKQVEKILQELRKEEEIFLMSLIYEDGGYAGSGYFVKEA